jgi:polar amino acid transport system permease protein
VTDLERFLDTFFNPKVAAESLPLVIEGFFVTIGVAVAVIVAGLAFGLALALVRALAHARGGILARVAGVAIVVHADVFRALPPLVVIILFYFGLPAAGLPMTAFFATWLSLTLVLSAFAEEIFWAGIIAVPRGQWEAARSTGMGMFATLVFVVLPQAVRMTIPPLTNRTIAITKGTALGSVVALSEILGQASSAASLAANPTPYTLGAIAYLLIFLPFVVFSRWVETRFAWKR